MRKIVSLLLCIMIINSSEANMKAVRFASIDTVSLEMIELPIPTPREKEILVKVAFSAINRADTLQRKGLYPPPKGDSDIIGLEVSGTVHALGPNVTRWRLGDRVMALVGGGGYAEFVTVREEHAMRIPSGLSMKEAAAIPEVWLTAFQLLRRVASVESGDYVLVHAAASGVGTAALQLLRLWGAHSIGTVGSAEKVELCKSLGAKEAINRKETPDFVAAVQAVTDGRGVNVILDCVGGSYWEKNCDALALDGTWVLYGLMGGAEVSGPLLRNLLSKRVRLMASTLRTRSIKYKAELVAAFEAEVLPHMTSNGPLYPIIFGEKPLAEAGKAHEEMETNSLLGKIVLRVAGEPPENREEL